MIHRPEDALSFWRNDNATVRDGVILGNNAATGTGMMFEQSSILDNSWGLAQNLQAVGIGGACYSAYGGTRITLDNVACKENHCEGINGRSAASGLMFFAGWENPGEFDNCCATSDQVLKNSRWCGTSSHL